MRRSTPPGRATLVDLGQLTLITLLCLVVAVVAIVGLVGLLGGCGASAADVLSPRRAQAEVFHRGLDAVDDQRFDEALQAFQHAAEDGLCESAWNNVGVAHARLGELDAALAAYGRALRECPTAVVRYNRGVVYLKRHAPSRAVVDLRVAVALQPDLAVGWNNLGLALLATGQLGEALYALRTAVRLRPALARPWNNLGVALTRVGRIAQARLAYRRALELDAAHGKARRNLERLPRAVQAVSVR